MSNNLELLRLRTRAILAQDDGLTTVEYALGTLAAAALAAVLYCYTSNWVFI